MSDVPSELRREILLRLPPDMYHQILLRLPAESLFRLRRVCKAWQSIIDDQSFIRSHTTNNHRPSPNLLIRTSTGTFYSFSLDSLNFVNGEQTIDAIHVKNLYRPGVPRISSLPVASCNGLILISDYFANKTWAIWNPFTGDFHELPQPDVIESFQIGVGIGYDSRSDDYKVVRSVVIRNTGEDDVYQTSIYSVKSKSWRMIMNSPSNVDRWCDRYGVYFNGALHWTSRNMIVALDLVTEEYRELQSPPVESRPFPLRLNALDGCLILSDAKAMRRAWVLRGYGTEQAIWVELFSAKERSVISGLGNKSLWPLAYSDSERQFIMQVDNRIIGWDIEKYYSKRVTINGLPGSLTSQVIPGTLFRLNGGGSTAVERTAEVKRKRSKPSGRVQFTAITIDSGCMADPVSELSLVVGGWQVVPGAVDED